MPMRLFVVSIIENATGKVVAEQAVQFDVELDEKRSYSVKVRNFTTDGIGDSNAGA